MASCVCRMANGDGRVACASFPIVSRYSAWPLQFLEHCIQCVRHAREIPNDEIVIGRIFPFPFWFLFSPVRASLHQTRKWDVQLLQRLWRRWWSHVVHRLPVPSTRSRIRAQLAAISASTAVLLYLSFYPCSHIGASRIEPDEAACRPLLDATAAPRSGRGRVRHLPPA